MKKIAIFPGSFDPFTKGHQNIIEKAQGLFDEIIIAIGQNSNKKSYFTSESKIKHIESIYVNESNIRVCTFEGLTTSFAIKNGASYILRGLRDLKDLDYERSIAQMNHDLNSNLETIFIVTHQQVIHINSTIVRELHKNGGIIDNFVTNSHYLVSSL